MQSLIYSVGKELEWGKHDSKETMLGRALSYLVLFSTLGTVYRWSGAVKILAIKDEDQPIKLLDEQQGVPIASPPPAEEPSDPFSDAQNVETSTTARKKSKSRHTVFNSFPNTPNWRTPETGNSPSPSVDSEESDAESTVESEAASDQEWGSDVGLPNTTRPARSAAERKWRSVFSNAKRWALRLFWNPSKKCLKTLKEFMTVPLWSVLLSIFICFIPPVQRFLDILVPFKEYDLHIRARYPY